MTVYTLKDLKEENNAHIFKHLAGGDYIYEGGLHFSFPGERAHTKDGENGSDIHIHSDREIFLVVQGKGEIEVNKEFCQIKSGDIIVVEPGEDHHVISDTKDPAVVLWLHSGKDRNPVQK